MKIIHQLFAIYMCALLFWCAWNLAKMGNVQADIPWTYKEVIEPSGAFGNGIHDRVYLIDGPYGKFLYIDGSESIGLVQIK